MDKNSLLLLRRVSKGTKAFVDALEPSLLSSLVVSFPLPQTAFPKFTSLSSINVICPDDDHFDALLAFRRSLQAVAPPQLTSLTLSNASIDSILAFRWGPYSCIAGSDCKHLTMWKNIAKISVSLKPWWETHTKLTDKEKRGFKLLHDWLGSWTCTHLSSLRFEWIDLEDGPNPLLLDSFAAMSSPGRPWLSSRGIEWEELSEVRFKGVELIDEDIQEIKRRVKGIRKLLIETEWSEQDVESGLAPENKDAWVEDVLDERRFERLVMTPLSSERDPLVERIERFAEAVEFGEGSEKSFTTDWSVDSKWEMEDPFV